MAPPQSQYSCSVESMVDLQGKASSCSFLVMVSALRHTSHPDPIKYTVDNYYTIIYTMVLLRSLRIITRKLHSPASLYC